MKKVLIVEDNTAIRENTAELLELNNYRVLTAETLRQGYESAKKYLPDLIIYSDKMPETNGETFSNLFKNEILIRNIPFVLFSDGSISPELRNFSGIKIYLQKPFTEEKLLHAITVAFQCIKV